ncbi:UDP-N-acetylglucosamine transporter-like [Symsagittifera roscoffensis]|uniref:UDP-N-acetylglucosamine transporter-like n=1 Tax=Symsagittifera roscoffensis TaxID=84072 RepID=UPI00307C0DB6
MSSNSKHIEIRILEPDEKEDATRNVVLFLALTVLTAAADILINQSRNSKDEKEVKVDYDPAVMVFLIEFIKLGLNFLLLSVCLKDVKRAVEVSKYEIFSNWVETFKCSVPAFIYVIQNNLSYLALTYLDPGTFEITLQLKLLTTALLMRLILDKRLNIYQWASLTILLIGVCIVESEEFGLFNENFSLKEAKGAEHLLIKSRLNATSNILSDQKSGSFNFIKGVLAAVSMTFMSALAGVYFEKLLKETKSKDSTTISGKNRKGSEATGVNKLWIRNIQMFLFSVPIAFIGIVLKRQDRKSTDLLEGFDFLAWLVVAAGVSVGLTTSLTLKYLNNIYKNFASSVSIVLASLSAMFFAGKDYGINFFIGSTLVFGSLFMYYRSGR